MSPNPNPNPTPKGPKISTESESVSTTTTTTTTTDASQESQRAKELLFNQNTRVYLIPTLDEYTPEEYNACYRIQSDEDQSRQDLLEAVAVARRSIGGYIPRDLQEHYTMRGIEHMISAQRLARRNATKNRVVQAVLNEQDRQFDLYEAGKSSDFVSDPTRNALASVSLRFSRLNLVYARFKGLQDAEEAAAHQADLA